MSDLLTSSFWPPEPDAMPLEVNKGLAQQDLPEDGPVCLSGSLEAATKSLVVGTGE